MGDRCYTSITCRSQDLERFAPLLHSDLAVGEAAGIPKDQVHLGFEDSNFGLGTNDHGELPIDVPYIGNHSSGDNYGPAEFACDGKTFVYIQASPDNGWFPVRFDPDTGEPNTSDLAEVQSFIAFKREVKKLMAETALPATPETPKPPLPPDPEEKNDVRSLWAEYALLAFKARTRTDDGDAISDLLADLGHWCDRNGTTMRHELLRAANHYDEETSNEGKSFDGVEIMTNDQIQAIQKTL